MEYEDDIIAILFCCSYIKNITRHLWNHLTSELLCLMLTGPFKDRIWLYKIIFIIQSSNFFNFIFLLFYFSFLHLMNLIMCYFKNYKRCARVVEHENRRTSFLLIELNILLFTSDWFNIAIEWKMWGHNVIYGHKY